MYLASKLGASVCKSVTALGKRRNYIIFIAFTAQRSVFELDIPLIVSIQLHSYPLRME